MNRPVVALLAALEALIAVAIGVGISLVPLSIMWALRLDLGLGWEVFWRASADIWLIGHGVDLTITLDPRLVAAVALPGAEKPFLLSIAPLSFALITLLLGVRLGRQSVESGARFIGPAAGLITFAVLTVLISLSAFQANAMPTIWMAFTFPTAIFALGVLIGSRGEVGRSGGRAEKVQQAVKGWAVGLPAHIRQVINSSFIGGVVAVSTVIVVSGITLMVLLLVNFSTIIRLFEGLQGGAGGALVLTAAQLMFMPNFVIWVASWFVGTGFAIGAGSSVSPAGTDLGPVPSLPILGALPTGDLPFAFFGIVVPVLGGIIAALIIRSGLVRGLAGKPQGRWIAVTIFGIGLFGGLLMAGLAWASGGAAGPGRLSVVGPEPWITGGIAAAEFAVAAAIGMLAGNRSSASR